MKRVRVVGTALALLAIAAASIAAAPAKKAPAKAAGSNDSDVVLARVGTEAITKRTIAARLEEIPEQYRSNYQTPEGRQQLLDRIIEERVWMKDAEANGIANRPDVQRQLAQSRRDLLIRTRINELLANNPPPSDSEVQSYYDGHLADFKTPASVAMRHIQLKTEADARKVLALAKAKGADWSKLVTQFTTDTLTKTNGGNLGTVTKDGGFANLGPQPALAESAMALGEGNVGGPYRTAKGWHVIKVDTYHADATRPLDQVRSFITRQISQQRQQSFYQDQLGKAKVRIKVDVDSATIKPYLVSKKTAREMFQDAQQAGGPDARIDAYRKVVETYPDAEISPQAQFMIGFIQSEELKKYDDAEKSFRELLAKYPKSELAASAQWMVDHMRTEEAPDFLHTKGDSVATTPAPAAKSAKK